MKETPCHVGESGQKKVLRGTDKKLPQPNRRDKNCEPEAPIHDDAFLHGATNPDFSRAAKPRVDWAVARHFRTPKCDDTISLPSAGDFADFAQGAGENFRIDELLGVHCCL